MILTGLIVGITILAIMQGTANNRYAAVIYAAPMVVHHVIGDHMGGWTYYLSDSIFAMIVIWLMVKKFDSKLSSQLAFASFISILLNFFGWCLWVSYSDPEPYNWSFLLLYTWVAYLMLKGNLIWSKLPRGSARYLRS